VLADGNVDQAELERILVRVDDEIERAVEKAKIAPQPTIDDLLTDVYASPNSVP
jgi:TPP-dependent pyruvate/acetoin dehydrogenase alpha subunit